MTITADVQDAWPPRVLVTVSGLTIGDQVVITRMVGATETPVRAGTGAATDTAMLAVDAELPFGVPVYYRAVVNGGTPQTTAPVTYVLPGGKVALTDAITGLAAEVMIGKWPEKTFDPETSRFKVGGRTVVVSGEFGMWEGEIEFYVETTSSHDQVMTLISTATEGIIQMRQPGGYDGVDSYVAVIGARVRRFSQDGSDQRRLIVLQVAEVESWAPALETRSYTYADLEAVYDGLTYADLEADYATYLDLARAELNP